MPRKKTERHWFERAATLTEEGLRAAEIFRQFEREGQEPGGRKDYPGQRTIERLVKEHRARPEPEQREYALFRWPDSMEAGALPWEASRAGLDLVRRYEAEGWRRPTVASVRWYWRVMQAAPGIPADAAQRIAVRFQTNRDLARLGLKEMWDTSRAELALVYEPWRNQDHRAIYAERIKDSGAEVDEVDVAAYSGDSPQQVLVLIHNREEKGDG